METRKEREREFHDRLRSSIALEGIPTGKELLKYMASREVRFHPISRRSYSYVETILKQRAPGMRTLDYCCGLGDNSLFLAKNGAIVDGIDISDVSVEKSEQRARIESVTENTTFHVMDAENLTFQDDTFDVAVAHGCLHHLDYEKAMQQLSRVIKHDGFVICTEAVRYNPIIHRYRKLTPHLRTEWEVDNLLGMKHLRISEKYFAKIDVRFFNLATLACIPFRNTFVFNPLLNVLEKIDSVLLEIPVLKWMAWQMVIIFEKPNSVGVGQPR